MTQAEATKSRSKNKSSAYFRAGLDRFSSREYSANHQKFRINQVFVANVASRPYHFLINLVNLSVKQGEPGKSVSEVRHPEGINKDLIILTETSSILREQKMQRN